MSRITSFFTGFYNLLFGSSTPERNEEENNTSEQSPNTSQLSWDDTGLNPDSKFTKKNPIYNNEDYSPDTPDGSESGDSLSIYDLDATETSSYFDSEEEGPYLTPHPPSPHQYSSIKTENTPANNRKIIDNLPPYLPNGGYAELQTPPRGNFTDDSRGYRFPTRLNFDHSEDSEEGYGFPDEESSVKSFGSDSASYLSLPVAEVGDVSEVFDPEYQNPHTNNSQTFDDESAMMDGLNSSFKSIPPDNGDYPNAVPVNSTTINPYFARAEVNEFINPKENSNTTSQPSPSFVTARGEEFKNLKDFWSRVAAGDIGRT